MNCRNFLIAAIMASVYCSCKSDKDGMAAYEKLKKSEMASGKKADSMFLGIYLGMPSKDFYMHCWDQNKKGYFRDGQNNTAVLYSLKNNELKYNASLNFYPFFLDEKISGMWATFNYDEWSPWNKKYFADSLLLDVLSLYKKWYKEGNAFIQLKDNIGNPIYVKVDGNRRIIISKADEMMVRVDYSDLFAEEALSKKKK